MQDDDDVHDGRCNDVDRGVDDVKVQKDEIQDGGDVHDDECHEEVKGVGHVEGHGCMLRTQEMIC